MKYQRKRAVALLMAFFMALSLAQHHGTAILAGVYFTAANEQLMPLNDETMPFYSGNTMYVCHTVFDGTDLGVRYIRNYSMGLGVLYTQTTGLYFDLNNQCVKDKNGVPYQGYAIEKNGYLFFPLPLVCAFFGLNWTINNTDTAPLLRITSATAYLDDASFISAAASMMASRYAAYEKQYKESQPDSGGTPGKDPVDEPVVTPPPVHAAAGQKVYLILSGSSEDAIRTVMQTLDGTPVTFLLTVQQMEDGDLVRSLLGSGHAIALKVLSRTEEDIRSELLRARELVWQSSFSLLQLVWYDGQADLTALLEESGCLNVTAVLERSSVRLQSESDAESLLRLIGKHREDLSVYLGDDTNCAEGLGNLLSKLSEAQYRLCAWRLTY